VLYAVRARGLARRGRPVPRRTVACFAAGIIVIAVALLSPIDRIGEERLFWVHMVQHLLLGDIGALLVVLGLTGPVLRPVLAAPGVGRLRVLAHPLVALPLWVASLYVWHLPFAYEGALHHDAVHAFEHLCFFSAGALMWAAIVEPLPGPAWFTSTWKAGYVLAVRTASGILGLWFVFAGRAVYSSYGVSDQRIAGGIMIIEGSVLTLLVFAWLFLRVTRESELRQSLLDAGATERVAERAARYGRRPEARR
jgi:cytochrome c oxidase assembly factor CtaG